MSKIKVIYIRREYPVEVQHYDIVAHFKNWDLMPYNEVEAPPRPEIDEDESADWDDVEVEV